MFENLITAMLTAIVVIEKIMSNVTSKDNIWVVNKEEEYHEAR
jgi:hypothetical protein